MIIETQYLQIQRESVIKLQFLIIIITLYYQPVKKAAAIILLKELLS